MSKTVNNANPARGGQITYTITVTNNGPQTATNVNLTDTLPEHVTYVTSSGGTFDAGTWSANIPSLGLGADASFTITVMVNSDAPGGTPITNTASATATEHPPAPVSDSVDFTVASADLILTKDVDEPLPNRGEQIIYTITVTNDGPQTATSVNLTDTLPEHVTYVSHTGGGTFDTDTRTWSATIDELGVGASETFTITVTVNGDAPGGTDITNTASADSPNVEEEDADTATDSATFRLAEADISVAMSTEPGSPSLGATITFDILVTNNGPQTATNIVLSGDLPPQLVFVGGSGSVSNGTWSAAVGDLAPGSTALSLQVQIIDLADGQPITFTVDAEADQYDSDLSNNSSSVTINGATANLQMSIAPETATRNPGETVTFTITVTNAGPNTATDITVSSSLLPTGLSYAGGSSWSDTIGSLANGGSTDVTVTLDVDATTPGDLTFTAGASTPNQYDPDPAVANASATVTVPDVDLGISITVDDETPEPGQTITYTITVTNNSDTHGATNIDVQITLPADLSYTGDNVGGAHNAGVWTYQIGALASEQNLVISITADVDASVADGTELTTSSQITGADQIDTNTANNQDNVSITVTEP